jgi:acyl-CoA thioesterase
MKPTELAADRAARIRELFDRDRYAALLGLELVAEEPVTVAMPICREHENFYDVTHGGAMFSLADCAFSLASNAHGDRAVAIDTHLVLTAATHHTDILTAVAEEVTRGRTLATYRITLTRGDGRIAGLFTGTVHITPRAS